MGRKWGVNGASQKSINIDFQSVTSNHTLVLFSPLSAEAIFDTRKRKWTKWGTKTLHNFEPLHTGRQVSGCG